MLHLPALSMLLLKFSSPRGRAREGLLGGFCLDCAPRAKREREGAPLPLLSPYHFFHFASITNMTPTKSPKRNGEEESISPRRSPRLVANTNSLPRRSPRLRARRNTPFPREKIILSPPPKPKPIKVHFPANVDAQKQFQRISRVMKADYAKVVAFGLGLLGLATLLSGWLMYKQLA